MASSIPKRSRTGKEDQKGFQRYVTRALGALSHQACVHPIYTMVVTAMLASTCYMQSLETSLLSVSPLSSLDVAQFLLGSRDLRLGHSTSWRWQMDDSTMMDDSDKVSSHWALTTLVLPGPEAKPALRYIEETMASSSAVVQPVAHTSNIFSSISNEISVAFQVPFTHLEDFLRGVREIPDNEESRGLDTPRSWVLKPPVTFEFRVSDSWTSFIDLIRNVETVDFFIMALGYAAMCLTTLSLFASMQRLGSRFWLATLVLVTGVFAFVFGLMVTNSCGVPITMLLLSQAVPFLVVTVGFEKPIRFTHAVMYASTKTGEQEHQQHRSILDSVQVAIHQEGWLIVRDYAVEIAILAAGAALRVKGGLSQFCFLAAWILFFNCVLLFSFYTAILCVKLEIERIRCPPHKMEKNQVTARTAELEFRIFGCRVKAANVSRFKFLMVGGFVVFNVLSVSSLACRAIWGVGRRSGHFDIPQISNLLVPMSINPFKVAANGLDDIYVSARVSKTETLVTVLPPIRFALKSTEHAQQPLLDVLGGGVLDILASLENPVISKLVIAALTLSLVLNSHLMYATRWGLRETQPPPLPAASRHPNPKAAASLKSIEEMTAMLKAKKASLLEDEDLISLCLQGKLPSYALEKTLDEDQDHLSTSRVKAFTRAVKIRRAVVSRTPSTLNVASGLESSKTPYQNYNYELVQGACCENVIGYLPLPVGVAGPMIIDGQSYFIPMATTEGVLVASASRGCKAINAGGGAVTVLNGDGMTRGPCVSFPSVTRAAAAKHWVDSEEGQRVLAAAFDSTSRFARLQGVKAAQAGAYLYMRFKSTTGDAMGMNMISKGAEKALQAMTENGFSDMATISVSGNYCMDKKVAAVNWIDGRGKSIIAEATVPGDAVRSVLKTSVEALVELNTSKNLIGSAMAGSIGGFNAHASNLVTAVFLATGQDPAQNVESSSCITIMKSVNDNLHISVSMPSIEVGTIGGGTILEAQAAMLDMLGVRGAHLADPGTNARQLARIVAAAVLAGELSTCAALAAGHLVSAHMAHNRSGPTRVDNVANI